jgi:hypothetical protein
MQKNKEGRMQDVGRRRIALTAAFCVIAVAFTSWAQESKPAQETKPAQQSQSAQESKPTPETKAAPEMHVQAGESMIPKQAPEAKPGDVDTIGHVMAAVYDVISGPAGERDWDRFRSLFYKDARLIPSGRRPDGTIGARTSSVEDYIERGRPFFLKEGFYERAASNDVEEFDHMAQVWSTYESRHNKDDKEPFQRGINSFQLFNDGKRWYVLTIYWQGEDKGHPIPSKYLGGVAGGRKQDAGGRKSDKR